MGNERYIELKHQPAKVKLKEIPVLDYVTFSELITELLKEDANHCLNYFVVPLPEKYMFICCIGCDDSKSILVFSHEQDKTASLVYNL